MNEILKELPEMKAGAALMACMEEYPDYSPEIKEESSAKRLIALSGIRDIYIPSRMSEEIYHKLYMGLVRSLQKKEGLLAVRQQNENHRGIRGRKCQMGILGGSDSFSIIGTSGIGKSSAIFRSVGLITKKDVIETAQPYRKIIPCIVVQCPYDSSVKGMLWEILRCVDEILDSRYYSAAARARATTDMLIGSVSQVALQHIGLLVVDEIQNVVNSRNGKSLVGMLTQLINNSGISICMVGTPESVAFFEQAMQLARRSLGLQYGAMEFGDEFAHACKCLWRYQYTKEGAALTPGIMEWLYEHSGGNISILVSLIHDAQEISILAGKDTLNLTFLEEAYQKRLAMLHGYLEPPIRKKGTAPKPARPSLADKKKGGPGQEEGKAGMDKRISELAAEIKGDQLDAVGTFRNYFAVEEVVV